MRSTTNGVQRMLYVYDPRELASLPHRGRAVVDTPGEVAARCFELFDEGRPLKEIVRELRKSPEIIEDLYERWLNMGGSGIVLTPYAKDEFIKVVGPFADIAELLELVQTMKKRPEP